MYALIRSRSDGRLGPRMLPTQIDCRSSSTTCGLSGAGGRLTGRGITIAALIKVLPNHLGGGNHIVIDRPVLNQTDLDGAFDFTLEWTPDRVAPELRAPSSSSAAPWLLRYRPFAFALDSYAPNFLSALEEQLGLRLEHQLAPEPVLVIDRIEPPITN